MLYRLEGVAAPKPEIVVPRSGHARSNRVVVHRPETATELMIRTYRGLRVTGEIACEDARRRRLTSVAAMRSYVDRFSRPGRSGTGATRALLEQLDPIHASRSTLEVKTRRLLVANGFADFVREFPLDWNGRVYRFDFALEHRRAILETNGRRWHDDPMDYEHDNEKWSVPGRHGYRLVLATWAKVTRHPDQLLVELAATLAA